MRYLKMLGLAAVAATALTAFVGAGSAWAGTELCATTTNPCTSQYGNDTTINAQLKSGTTAVLTAGFFGNLTATGSAVTVTTTAASGTPLPGDVTGLAFTGVTHDPGGEPCTVTVETLPYTGSITTETKSVNDNGTLTVNNPRVHLACGSSTDCTLTATSVTLQVKGGPAPEVVANEVPLTAAGGGGLFCPSTSKWDATYVITNPTPLYVI